MDKSIVAVLVGGQRVERQRVELVAHNLANLATTGFRAQRPVASEHVVAAGGPSVAMPRLAASMVDTTEGAQSATGGALDVAIAGPGYFQVAGPDGEVLLTRAGRFALDAAGRIVAPDGAALLSTGGAPIVAGGGGEIRIGTDGGVSVDGALVGRIGVVEPDGPLERRAGARFASPEGSRAVAGPSVVSGALEASNVDAVAEVARMIEASRRYEALQGLVQREDERIRNAVETFSRAS